MFRISRASHSNLHRHSHSLSRISTYFDSVFLNASLDYSTLGGISLASGIHGRRNSGMTAQKTTHFDQNARQRYFHSCFRQMAPSHNPTEAMKHQWTTNVVPYAEMFSLLGEENANPGSTINSDTQDLYMYKMQHSPSQFTVYHMVNPRLQHYNALKWIRPHQSILKRPNGANGRDIRESKRAMLLQIIQRAAEKFGPCSGVDFTGIYEHELWLHLQQEPVPKLKAPQMWRRTLTELYGETLVELFSVQAWLRNNIATYESVMDKIAFINELLSVPDAHLQRRIEDVFREEILSSSGTVVVVASDDQFSQLQDEMSAWIEKYGAHKFTPPVSTTASLPAATHEVRRVEYRWNEGEIDQQFFAVSYQLPPDAPEIHSAILNFIQAEFMGLQSPLNVNVSRLLGAPVQLVRETIYDPITRVLEFAFPSSAQRQVAAADMAELISATLRYMTSNETLCKQFLQSAITQFEIPAKHNERHFEQLCDFVTYRTNRPSQSSLSDDPFFNRQLVLNALKSNGTQLLKEIVASLVQHRSIVAYEPSSTFTSRLQKELSKIAKHDPRIPCTLPTHILLQAKQDSSQLTLSDIDPSFHRTAFCAPSERVDLSPSLTVFLDYTARGDLVDIGLLSLPDRREALLDPAQGFTSFLHQYLTFAGVKGSGADHEAFYKESKKWSVGMTSSAKTHLRKVSIPNIESASLSSITGLELRTRCTVANVYRALDEMSELLRNSRLIPGANTTNESITVQELQAASQDFCNHIIMSMTPFSIEKAREHVLAMLTPAGFQDAFQSGLAALQTCSNVFEKPDPKAHIQSLLEKYTSSFLKRSSQRIFTITVGLKYRDTLLDELKRVKSQFSSEDSDEEQKSILQNLEGQLMGTGAYFAAAEPKKAFAIMEKQFENSPLVLMFGFKAASVLDTKKFAHGMIFAELLKNVMRTRFGNCHDNDLFDLLHVEQSPYGAFLVGGTSQIPSSLDHFTSLVQSSMEWIMDFSNSTEVEQIMEKHQVYVAACKRLEAHNHEYFRTFEFFDVSIDYDPQEVKNYFLNKEPLHDVLHTMGQVLGDSDRMINFQTKGFAFGCGRIAPRCVTESKMGEWLIQRGSGHGTDAVEEKSSM